ncbi:RHS repeat domain-containing protein [Cohnella fermenti]|uniref:RHS repeat-associated core domain-containing protein n=1 Tax=Cohnella fermenti TaxID=2565925 RepID=A0A4S4BGG3_9BACL|nr:RHS repeat-associated core domain-containing protein [Cohnella fermenti]THF73415.1 RHS repeat-associated core domain-containing protein [Cohnella fermenti]
MRNWLLTLGMGFALVWGVLLVGSSYVNAAVSDDDVYSAFNAVTVQEQINQTNKPQYADRAGNSEIIDPASGNLIWQSTQIQLPGREGLDLNIGVMYDLKNSFFYMRHKKTDGNLKKYNYLSSRYDLGAGWAFQFPSIQKLDDYLYYHGGDGAVYKANTKSLTSSLIFFSLIGYPGTDKQLVEEIGVGSFSNGVDSSKYYLEYDDDRREYFSADGRLLGLTDRFGNKITFQYVERTAYDDETYKYISSITDTVGRVVTFTYNDSTTTNYYSNITLSVADPNGNVVQKVTYGKWFWNLLFNGEEDGTAPVLGYIIDENSEYTYFDYGVSTNYFHFSEKTVTANSGWNSYHPLLYVQNKNSKTYYEYDKAARNLGAGGFGEENRVNLKKDILYKNTSTTQGTYNAVAYTYINDYTGYPTYKSASAMDKGYSFSSTATLSSSTATNGLATTTEFNGNQQEHIITTKAPNGEKQVITNLTFSAAYPSKPTKIEVKVYSSDSDTAPVTLYLSRNYTSWGTNAADSKLLTLSQYTSTKYLTSYTYESNRHFLSSKSWYQEKTGSQLSESYTYYSDGRLKTYTDANGVTTTYCYEAISTSGAVTSNCSNSSTVVSGMLQKVKATKSLGNGQSSISEVYYSADTSYAYPSKTVSYFTTTNSTGTAITQAIQKTMTYDMGTGLLKTETDSAGNTTSYAYDILGRVTSVTYPSFTNLNGTEYNVTDSYTYTNTNIPSTADSANAGLNALKVISQRKYVRTSDSSSTIVSNQVAYYDGFGSLRYATETNSGTTQITQYRMDDLNRAVYAIDPMGNTTTVTYDAWGNAKETADVYGNLYVTENDPKARKVTQYLVAAMDVTAYRADSTVASLKSNYIEHDYDQWGNLSSNKVYKDWPAQSQPLMETYTYDLVGNLKTYADPNGNTNSNGVTTSYSYDGLNQLTSVTDAIDQMTTYTYDANGLMTGATIQAGASGTPQSLKTKTYNEAGLMTSKLDTSSNVETYAYNNLGLLQQAVDRKSTVFTYAYDEQQHNTIVTATGSSGGTQQNKTIIGSNGILYTTNETYQNGSKTGTLTAGMDYLNRVTSLSLQNANSTYTSYLGLTYDSNGRITVTNAGATSSGGFYVRYKYAQKRLDKVQVNGSSITNDTAASNVTYAYYANGQVKSVTYPTLTSGSTLVTTYVYDALGRVSTVTNAKGTTTLSKYTYTYDNNGNVVALVEVVTGQTAKSSTYSYDKLNRLTGIVRSGRTITYVYDLQGNRQTVFDSNPGEFDMNETSYTYDLFNVLTSATYGTNSASFDYTPDGMRYKKTSGSAVTQYRYNPNGEVIAEVNSSNATVANYVRGDRLLVKKDVSTSKDYYYLYNGHGDVVQIVDTAGAIVNSYSYDEWGNLASQSEQISNMFKYAGEVYDSETGLYYLRARYYDPSMGRFINEDTYEGQIDNPLTLNLYTYVGNNPLRYTDPSGHCFTDWLGKSYCKKAWNATKGFAVDTYNKAVNADWSEIALGLTQLVGGATEAWAGSSIAIAGSETGVLIAVGGYIAVDGVSNMSGGASRIKNGWSGSKAGDEWNFMKNAYKDLLGDGLGSNFYNATQIGIGIFTIGSGISSLPAEAASVTKFGYGIKLVSDGAKTYTKVSQSGSLVTISTYTEGNVLVTQTVINTTKITSGTLLIGVDGINVYGAEDSLH